MHISFYTSTDRGTAKNLVWRFGSLEILPSGPCTSLEVTGSQDDDPCKATGIFGLNSKSYVG